MKYVCTLYIDGGKYMSKCTAEMVGSLPHDGQDPPCQKAATFGWVVLPSCQGAQKPDKSILLLSL